MLDWVGDRPAAELSMRDRGLAHGDRLLETLVMHADTPCLLERHLARLEEGYRRLAIPLNTAVPRQELLAFCAALGDGVAKLAITRGRGLRGYAPPAEAPPRRIFFGSPRPAYPERHWQQDACLFAYRTRPTKRPLLASLKHLNRPEQVLTRAKWSDAGHVEGPILSVHERVVEGIFNSLLLVLDGTLMAPNLRCCGVAGVMRVESLEYAGGTGVPLAIRDVSMAELATADEVLLCSSQFGIWPVRASDEHVWPVGELTRKLQDQLRGDLDLRF